jgi:hypothetical protein
MLKKTLVKLGVTLGVAGSFCLGANLIKPPAAIALTEPEVLSRLTSVPIFTLVDNQGTPVLGTDPADKSKQPILLFFLNQQDAQAALASYRKAQPEKGKEAQVLLLSLKDALETFKKIKGDNKILYSIEPSPAQLQSAIEILKTDGEVVAKDGKLVTKEGQPFEGGVPLFYGVSVAKDGKSQFITSTQEITEKGKKKEVTFVPVYFSRQDLQRDIDAAKSAAPDTNIKVKVTMFNNFLAYLYGAKTSAEVPFQLIPSEEAAQFANTLLQQAAQKASPGATPKPAPK